jgi:hypothetical protein
MSTTKMRAVIVVCVHVKENSLLQELLSHSVDRDAARGTKQKLSRSRDLTRPNRMGVARKRWYSR